MKFPAKKKDLQNLNRWVTLQHVQLGFVVVLGLGFLYQSAQLHGLNKKVESVDGLEQSTSTVLQEVSQGKDYLTSFGSDINEIRKFLLLPTKNYDFTDLGEVELSSEDEEEEDLNTQLFTYVQRLGTYEKNQKEYAANLSTFQAGLGDAYWSTQGLSVNKEGEASDVSMDFAFLDTTFGNEEVFAVSLGYEGEFSVDSFNGDLSLSDKSSAEAVLEDLRAYVANDLVKAREHLQILEEKRVFLAEFLKSASSQSLFSTLKLTLGTELQSAGKYHYPLLNADHNTVAEVSLFKEDATLRLSLKTPLEGHESDYEFTVDTAESVFAKTLNEDLDTRTDVEKRVEQNRQDIEAAFGDRAFKAVLSEMELQFGAAQETDVRISYPITNAAGEIVRVLFIDKATGEVKVEHADGQDSQTLSMAIEEFEWSGKKKIPILGLA